MFDLTGKVALVTGSAQGIGRTSAEKLAELGAKLICADINTEKLNDTAAAIRQGGGEAVAVKLDLRSNESIEACVRQGAEAFGGIDILVNCAGILGTSSIEEMKRDDEWRRVIDTDLSGTFYCCREALSDMIRAHSGVIVNIASMWGEVGASCEAAYSAAKAGVIGLTKALAKEVGPSGVRVNAVSPGVVMTDMMAGFSDEDVAALKKETPLIQLGMPEDIADAVIFLASEKAHFITGQVLSVNGGMVI